MEENISNQPVNPTEIITQPTSNLINNQRGNILIILGVLFLLLIVGGGAYYLGTQRNKLSSQPNMQIENTSISTSAPTITQPTITNSTQTPTASTNWEAYTSQEFGYSISFPREFEATNNGKNSISLAKKSDEPGRGPLNFIYLGVIPKGFQSGGGDIYNFNTKEFNVLINMKVGEIKSLREGFNDPGLEKAFSYTRLPDTKLGGLTAKTYVNTNPWEFPRGTKEYRYYVDKGNNTYLVGGYIEGKDFPQVYYISENLFQQILQTFKFTN